MTFLVHLIIAAAYLAVAGAAAAGLPEAVFGLAHADALILAGFAVLLGVLLQLAIAHFGQGRRLAQLAHDHDELAQRLAAARNALADVQEVLAGAEPDALRFLFSRSVAELEAERRLLDTLRRQLAGCTAEAAFSPAARDEDAPVHPDEPAPDARAGLYRGLGETFGAQGSEADGPHAPAAAESAPAFDSPEGRAIFEAVLEAVCNSRVNVYLQPIVSLPTRRTVFYESFSRITDEDGTIIKPERYIRIAEEADVVSAIDNNLLFRCVQLVRKTRRHNRDYVFFCNTSPYTLRDETFFPQFIEFMEENRELADGLIFEFAASDILARDPEVLDHLRRLADAGFRFSLDRVGSLDLDFAELAERNFRFIKIEAEKLKAFIGGDDSGMTIDLFQRALRRAGLELIVEKIESEPMLVDLLDFAIPYGQGYLFGPPRLSRAAA